MKRLVRPFIGSLIGAVGGFFIMAAILISISLVFAFRLQGEPDTLARVTDRLNHVFWMMTAGTAGVGALFGFRMARPGR